MALLRNRLLWASGIAAALSGTLLLVVVGYLAVLVYSGLASDTPIVDVLVDIAVPVLAVVTVLLVVLVLSCAGAVWALVRAASLPRSDRLAAIAEWLEREYPPLRAVGLSSALEPPEPSAEERAEDALAELKRQYVAGELTEAEFERKVDRLVANDSIDEARAARERRRVVDEASDRN